MIKHTNCIICHKPITSNLKAILDRNHEAHLECWCDLLLNTNISTKKERENRVKELI